MAGPAPCPCPSPVCVRVLSRMGWGPHCDRVSPGHSTHAGATRRDLSVWVWASRSSPQRALGQDGRAKACAAQQVHDARGHGAQASLRGREQSPASERGRRPPESTKPQLNKQPRRQPRPAGQAVDFGAVSQHPCPLPGRGPGSHRLPQPRSKREGVCPLEAPLPGCLHWQPPPRLRQLELRVPVAPGGCPQAPGEMGGQWL